MRIADMYGKETIISFEVFPPKKEGEESVIDDTLLKLSKLSPAFISVTYGAGGSKRDATVNIAKKIAKLGVTPLAHLTCVCATRADITPQLDALKAAQVENILALRGDIPKGISWGEAFKSFAHASDLACFAKKRGDFCIGAASYPEAHFESQSLEKDIQNLKKKHDAGVEFFITQLFFENWIYFRFVDRLRASGIDAPVSAGVMPVLEERQILRMASLCGCSIPSSLTRMMAKYSGSPGDFQKAGMEFAAKQIEGLISSGASGVHIYSMNRWQQTCRILEMVRGSSTSV